jgi:arylsulfatase A-like enzyme
MGGNANRRDVLRAAGALGLFGALPALAGCDARAQRQRRPPNMVFILADDLGYGDVGCYGARDYPTPHTDALAAAGVRLTQGYASSCVCSPTRVALITGRYQQRLAVGLEEPINQPTQDFRLPPGHPTLPSLLKLAGYRTALIGKWHMGFNANAGPLDYGYDHFFGYPGGGTNYYQQPGGGTPQTPDTLFLDRDPVRRPGYLTDLLGDEAVSWIRSGTDPFFLSLHFSAPHAPWVAPGDEAAAAGWTDTFDRNRGSLAVFAQMVMAMDQNIGKVLAAIDQRGLADETIVVFTSDNGGERFSDMWPLTGVKGELLEGGIRVPLILRWRGRIAPGAVSPQVMASMDFLPTLLAAAGASADPGFPADGENLLPVLLGQAPPRLRRLFWRHKLSDQAAVRDANWKYLRLGGKEHLFDLSRDERERADRKMEEPQRLSALRDAYNVWNATMLPYPSGSFSYDVSQIDADRY